MTRRRFSPKQRPKAHRRGAVIRLSGHPSVGLTRLRSRLSVDTGADGSRADRPCPDGAFQKAVGPSVDTQPGPRSTRRAPPHDARRHRERWAGCRVGTWQLDVSLLHALGPNAGSPAWSSGPPFSPSSTGLGKLGWPRLSPR